eukprot:2280912-Rhodomonas_salina.1
MVDPERACPAQPRPCQHSSRQGPADRLPQPLSSADCAPDSARPFSWAACRQPSQSQPEGSRSWAPPQTSCARNPASPRWV